jgi:hypothetical protein
MSEQASSLRGVAIAVGAGVVLLVSARMIFSGGEGVAPSRVRSTAPDGASPPTDTQRRAQLRAKKGAKAGAKVPPPRPVVPVNRDAAQAKVHREALVARIPVPPPPTTATAIPPGRGSLDPEYVSSSIREQFVPVVRECYETARAKNEMLSGMVVLSFDVVGAADVGGVADAVAVDRDRTDLDDPALLDCILESVNAIVLPAPEGEGRAHVDYPFIFRLK